MSRSLDGSPYASERSARSLEPTGTFALVLILAKTAIFDPDFFQSNKDHHLPLVLLLHPLSCPHHQVVTSERRGAATRSTEAQGTLVEVRAPIKLRSDYNMFSVFQKKFFSSSSV